MQSSLVRCGLLVSLSLSPDTLRERKRERVRLRIPPIGVMMVPAIPVTPLSVVTVMVIRVMVLLPGESFVCTPIP